MGCWGITAFESDAGLDAVDYIRDHLPKDGKLELGKIIKSLQKDEVRLPQAQDGESHTSPMALAEILVKFLDKDVNSMDFDEDWAAEYPKFSSITSFTASKQALRWLRDYLSETLTGARKNEAHRKWGGWFEEKNWINWQEHMAGLVSRLDTLLATAGETVELTQADGLQLGKYSGKNALCCSPPHSNGGNLMNFFARELEKIVGPVRPDAVYAGRACFVRLGPLNRAKVEFTTLGHADHYEALKVTVLNREDGPVDALTLRFCDILGKKQVSNPNFCNGITPYVWMDRGTAAWYVYQPSQADYQALSAELSDYLDVFLECPTQTEENGQSLS